MDWTLRLDCYDKDRQPISSLTWVNTILGPQQPLPDGTAYVSPREVRVGELSAADEPWVMDTRGKYWPLRFAALGHEREPAL